MESKDLANLEKKFKEYSLLVDENIATMKSIEKSNIFKRTWDILVAKKWDAAYKKALYYLELESSILMHINTIGVTGGEKYGL